MERRSADGEGTCLPSQGKKDRKLGVMTRKEGPHWTKLPLNPEMEGAFEKVCGRCLPS